MRYAIAAILGAVLATACSAPLPAIKAGDVCTRCKRTITDPKLGVQVVTTSGQISTFRTPGCLATYLKDHSGDAKEIFVTDYPTGKLFPVSRAMFVRAKIDNATGEHDFYAYATVDDAVKEAKDVTGTVVDWAAVRSFVAANTQSD